MDDSVEGSTSDSSKAVDTLCGTAGEKNKGIAEEDIVQKEEECVENAMKNCDKSSNDGSLETGEDARSERKRRHKKKSKRKHLEVRCLQSAWQEMMTSQPCDDVTIVLEPYQPGEDLEGDTEDGSEDTGNGNDGSGDDDSRASFREEDPAVTDGGGAGCGGQDTDHDPVTAGGHDAVSAQMPGQNSTESTLDVTKEAAAAPPADGLEREPRPQCDRADHDASDDVTKKGHRPKAKVNIEGNNKAASLEGLAACKAKFASHYATMTRKRMDMNMTERGSSTVDLVEAKEQKELLTRRRRHMRAILAQEELSILQHLQSLQLQRNHLQRTISELEGTMTDVFDPNGPLTLEDYEQMQNLSRRCDEITKQINGYQVSFAAAMAGAKQGLGDDPAPAVPQDLSELPFETPEVRVPTLACPMASEHQLGDHCGVCASTGDKKTDTSQAGVSKTRSGNSTASGKSNRRLKSSELRPVHLRKQKLASTAAADQNRAITSIVKPGDQLENQNHPKQIDRTAKGKVRHKKSRSTKIQATSVGLLQKEASSETTTKPGLDNQDPNDSLDPDPTRFSTGKDVTNEVTKLSSSEHFLDVPRKGGRRARGGSKQQRRKREAAECSEVKLDNAINSNLPNSPLT